MLFTRVFRLSCRWGFVFWFFAHFVLLPQHDDRHLHSDIIMGFFLAPCTASADQRPSTSDWWMSSLLCIALCLVFPWRGSMRKNFPYRIRFTSSGIFSAETSALTLARALTELGAKQLIHVETRVAAGQKIFVCHQQKEIRRKSPAACCCWC